jgi:hypothetical protein
VQDGDEPDAAELLAVGRIPPLISPPEDPVYRSLHVRGHDRSRDVEMTGQYVLLLVAGLLGIIVAGVAIGCDTIGGWLWVVAGGALIVLGAAAMLAVASPNVPGNVPSRSSRIVGHVLPCDHLSKRSGTSRRPSACCSSA